MVDYVESTINELNNVLIVVDLSSIHCNKLITIIIVDNVELISVKQKRVDVVLLEVYDYSELIDVMIKNY